MGGYCPLTREQLLELIWLLLHEDLKPSSVCLNDWWHTPFRHDGPVPDYHELLEKLSDICGRFLKRSCQEDKDVVGLSPAASLRDCIEESKKIISAVLYYKWDDSVLGFRWMFTAPTYNDTSRFKERFKNLIFVCEKQLKS